MCSISDILTCLKLSTIQCDRLPVSEKKYNISMDAVCVLHYSFISSIQVFQTEGLQPDSIRGVIVYSLEEMV